MKLQLMLEGSSIPDLLAHARNAVDVLSQMTGSGIAAIAAEAPAAAEVRRGRGRPAKEEAAAQKAQVEQSVPPAGNPVVTFDMMKESLQAVTKPRAGERTDEEGFKRARAILDEHAGGVAQIKMIDPNKYAAVYHAAKAMLDGETAKPASAGIFD